MSEYRTILRDVLINGDAEASSGWSVPADGEAYATEIEFHNITRINAKIHHIPNVAICTVHIAGDGHVAIGDMNLFWPDGECFRLTRFGVSYNFAGYFVINKIRNADENVRMQKRVREPDIE